MTDHEFRSSTKITILILIAVLVFGFGIVGMVALAGGFKNGGPLCKTGIYSSQQLNDNNLVICRDGSTHVNKINPRSCGQTGIYSIQTLKETDGTPYLVVICKDGTSYDP